MATLTRCPRCNVTLLAAGRFRRESELKCPGCFEVFKLEEALAVSSELVHEALDAQADAATAVDAGTYSLAPSSVSAGGSGVGIPSFAAGGTRRKGSEDAAGDEEEDAAPRPTRRPRQEPKGSIVGLAIMLVLGGVFGIGGGLVVVKMIRGDKFKIPVPYLEQKWQEMAGWWAGKEEASNGPPAPKEPPTPPPPGKMAMPEKKFIFEEGEVVPTNDAEPEGTNPFPALSRPPKPAATGAAGTGASATTKPTGTAAGTAETAASKLPPAALTGVAAATPADVTAAIAALAPLMEGSTISPAAYGAACRIGSTTARMEDDASDEVGGALLGAETLLKTLTATREQRRELSVLADARFASPAAESGGVVISGVVQKAGQVKKYRTLTVLPAHAPKPENAVTIVSNHKFKVQDGKLVTVAGVIVAKPEEQLPGATGVTGPRVVWSGLVLEHPADN